MMKACRLLSLLLLVLFNLVPVVHGFVVRPASSSSSIAATARRRHHSLSMTVIAGEVFAQAPRSKSLGTMVGDAVVQMMLNSPFALIIIQEAKDIMKKTAEKNGIEWDELLKDVQGKRTVEEWEALKDEVLRAGQDVQVPDYYKVPFHAYKEGNLEWLAAFEQDIAAKSVGVRNFPSAGKDAEDVLRKCYDRELSRLGAVVESGGLIVDFGCGTGTSSRYLADLYPEAGSIIGYDLSPYMVVVGRDRLENAESKFKDRITIEYADIAATPLQDDCASMVSISYVFHEMSNEGRLAAIQEAYRLLKPGGCLAIVEMDPEAPGYVALRVNPFLFSIFKATEPWLLEYYDAALHLPAELQDAGFVSVAQSAATGRHFCMVARKLGYVDLRPSDEERLKTDEHMIIIIDD